MSLTSLWPQPRAASLLLTATLGMMLLAAAETASAQITPVCDRTVQVRDEIVRRARVSDCGAVTEAHLEAIRGLDLSDAGIATLKVGDFSGLTAMESLNLAGTALTTLEPGTFDGLNKLTQLDLGYNDALTTLEPGTFDGLNSLTQLDLGYNDALTTLEPSTFDGLNSLKELILSHTALTTLEPSTFDGLNSLTWLFLFYNDALTVLEPGTFDGLNSLTWLSLNDNALTVLEPGTFDGLNSLESLNLARNALTTLEPGTFDGLNSLKGLSLASNDLTTLEPGTFDGLNALTSLNLSVNDLTTLEPGTFDGLNSLKGLSLADNYLTTLEPGIFDGLNALTSLELQYNRVRLPITISLERIGGDRFQAKAHTGAPFAVVLPVQITNGSLLGEASHITIPTGRRTSDTLTVAHTAGTSDAITVDIGPLPKLPPDHNGYTLVKSADLPLHLSGVATSVEVTTLAIPATSGLDPNFPNPFNASTQIAYRLATPGPVQLEIYNVLGQPVRTLVNQFQPAGFYQVRWDARDQRGAPLAAGVYLTRLRYPDGAQTRRLLYLK